MPRHPDRPNVTRVEDVHTGDRFYGIREGFEGGYYVGRVVSEVEAFALAGIKLRRAYGAGLRGNIHAELMLYVCPTEPAIVNADRSRFAIIINHPDWERADHRGPGPNEDLIALGVNRSTITV